ncbi:hypothetical protein Y032_0067g135 [Ancylostoma ceylanicum]|uniref:RRM domain-containing protein n=1 Tax=Ancylostoma ceylanicum TaxID=53326 RepID=A0A016TZD3_9BILA|nr:hypothetical protein Y032_0067g135 [Ancylostoma ceylanicum]
MNNKKSAWIFIGGLRSDLTEGDVITVFSQFGEVVNINLPRNEQTGKPRGFCFLCYRNWASTTLAVDNFNGITLLGRTLKVNYVEEYKVPKYREDADESVKRLWEEGCGPKPIQLPGMKKEKTLDDKREKHHRKRDERKDKERNAVKSTAVAVSGSKDRLSKKNDSCRRIEVLRNQGESLIYNRSRRI